MLFSRLTLTAQLEVLARPVEHSWAACVALNPFLEAWRRRAATGRLRVTAWPRAADRWLSARAYANRFLNLLGNIDRTSTCLWLADSYMIGVRNLL